MAAGGPIVHHCIDAMIINPICPMSLASRPIVIPNTSKVIIKPVKKSKGEIKLWRDGSKCMTIKENYYCEIKKGKSPCKIIKFKKIKGRKPADKIKSNILCTDVNKVLSGVISNVKTIRNTNITQP